MQRLIRQTESLIAIASIGFKHKVPKQLFSSVRAYKPVEHSHFKFARSRFKVVIGNRNFCSVSLGKIERDTFKMADLFRLPQTVKPIKYELELRLSSDNLESGNFTGKVLINVDFSEDVSQILLHSNGLLIDEVKVDGTTSTFDLDVEHQLLIIHSGHGKGSGNVEITYSGSMLKKLVGLYSSKYKTSDGNFKSIATTKFEPTYARQAFPCFDEPNLKANFKIHIIKPTDADYIALSNMPVESEVQVEDGIKVSFQESVKMSTYLACWVVSDFKSSEDVIHSENNQTIPYRVFATPAQLAKTEYAAQVGKKVMEFYLDYFQIPFPLPKLDMLAIPDYSSGATEHWGIVTFRETALLFDKTISSSVNERRVATVIAHELAHSWFGNLVTMDWWNDIWLNEGFASYIEYKGVNAVHPDWKMLEQFILDDLHNVLTLDATLASHPIVQTASTPDEITSLFDTISYSKGASIIRMLENAIGNETFQQGVIQYLRKYAFANAVTQDLLEEFQSLVPDSLNLTEFLNTWTVQMGYPIMNAVKTDTGFRLTQKRYLTDPDSIDNTTTPFNYRWNVPVTYITDLDPVEKLVWFHHSDSHIDVVTDGTYVKFNSKQVGYYRVNYEPEVWNTLIENITEMDVPDRAHLIEESFRIAESGQIAYEVPLNLSLYLKTEKDYVPWAVAQTMFNELNVFMLSSSVLADYKRYVIDVVMPAVNHFTWTEASTDTFLTRLTRMKVLSIACSHEEQSCLDEARNRLQKFLYEGVKPSPDLKDLVYKYGMVNGNEKDWEALWQKFTEETDAGEKLSLLTGLAAIKDTSLIHRLLDFAKDETYIRNQDYPSVINYISNNPMGTQIVWVYFRENWNRLVDRFGLNDRYLHNMIPTVTSKFSTTTQKDELLAFYAANPEVGSGAAARRRALETVNNNIKWVKRNKHAVESWLKEVSQ